MSEWIKISDKPIPKDTDCFLYGCVHTSHGDVWDIFTCFGIDDFPDIKVTHWQPLIWPEPPEVAKEKI